MINAAANDEYRVLVTHLPGSEPNGQQWRWRATVLEFPGIAEVGGSREQVIQQIQDRISEILRHSEIVTLSVQATPSPAAATQNEALLAQGWDDHGLFKHDSEALRLFDEIEAERDRTPVIWE